MSKFTPLMSAAVLASAVGFAALPAPVAAQAAPNVAEIIVYGSDPCPRSTDDQVVVCARRPEAERYRIPPKMRPSGTPQQMQSWASALQEPRDRRRHRHQQLLAGRAWRTHRLPDQGQPGGQGRAQADRGPADPAAVTFVENRLSCSRRDCYAGVT